MGSTGPSYAWLGIKTAFKKLEGAELTWEVDDGCWWLFTLTLPLDPTGPTLRLQQLCSQYGSALNVLSCFGVHDPV